MTDLEKELEDKIELLKSIREELEKNAQMGYPNINKKDEEDEDQKIVDKKMDEHNEKKHGEAKDEDSAMKKGCNELVKFNPNGQWSI